VIHSHSLMWRHHAISRNQYTFDRFLVVAWAKTDLLVKKICNNRSNFYHALFCDTCTAIILIKTVRETSKLPSKSIYMWWIQFVLNLDPSRELRSALFPIYHQCINEKISLQSFPIKTLHIALIWKTGFR